MTGDRVYLFDSTLRDGAQSQGVDFTVVDKIAIAQALDRLGIDYVEGGWPGANKTDDALFADPPALEHAKLVAFCMTRRKGVSASNDPGLNTVRESGAKRVCMVGKTWDHQVEISLGVERRENVAMITESVSRVSEWAEEVMFDCEHFFDGYKSNPTYAIECAATAYIHGARWVVLCDTNGGALPHEIAEAVADVIRAVPGAHLGIHCHDDTGNAVANSLAAVRAGVRQVQGTFNGLGERCGNANLATLLPNLILKMKCETGVSAENLKRLTSVSRMIDERLNRPSNPHAPYVGASAFAHKGGLHVAAVSKDPAAYEHVPPEAVGNRRNILISQQSGRSNLALRLKEVGITFGDDDPTLQKLVEVVKIREHDGYAYEGALASFELLARRTLGGMTDFFKLNAFRVIDERRSNAMGELITLSEASVRVEVGDNHHMTVAEGLGPVHALDVALRKALSDAYPGVETMRLVDYKVRILNSEAGTSAKIRVIIDSTDESGAHWATVGVSSNVIDASYIALHDAVTYKLMNDQARQSGVLRMVDGGHR